MTPTDTTSYLDVIVQAINNRTRLVFAYPSSRYGSLNRRVEPYLLGQHKRTKRPMLQAWFIPTEYQEEELNMTAGWRNYDVAEISMLMEVGGEPFDVRPDFNAYQQSEFDIACQVVVRP